MSAEVGVAESFPRLAGTEGRLARTAPPRNMHVALCIGSARLLHAGLETSIACFRLSLEYDSAFRSCDALFSKLCSLFMCTWYLNRIQVKQIQFAEANAQIQVK